MKIVDPSSISLIFVLVVFGCSVFCEMRWVVVVLHIRRVHVSLVMSPIWFIIRYFVQSYFHFPNFNVQETCVALLQSLVIIFL